MRRITSRQNPIVARFRETARGDRRDVILLDGAHLIGEAMTAAVSMQTALVAVEAAENSEIARLTLLMERRGVEVFEGTSTVMAAASPVRSSSAIVALAVRPAPRSDIFAGDAPLVVVVCDVQDPGNAGAIVRVAEAAGASGVVFTGQSADPFGWKALRGSMGSALRLPIAAVPDVEDAVRMARARRAALVATVPRGGQLLFDAALTGATALLIGGEGAGLPDAVIAAADARVTIPMKEPVESLNAAVAAGILLFEARRQRLAAMLASR